MTNEILEKIKKFAINELNQAYGYYGSAESDDTVMLNSDDKQGNTIKITIKSEPE